MTRLLSNTAPTLTLSLTSLICIGVSSSFVLIQSVLSNDSGDLSKDDGLPCRNRGVFGIRRNEINAIRSLPEMLDRRLVPQTGHDDVAVLGAGLDTDYHNVSLKNSRVFHTVSPHSQGKGTAADQRRI